MSPSDERMDGAAIGLLIEGWPLERLKLGFISMLVEHRARFAPYRGAKMGRGTPTPPSPHFAKHFAPQRGARWAR
jgi:hypothetical protein